MAGADEAASSPDVPAAAMHDALLHWYDAHRRDLPWRDVDDPYAVWVSEVMLQQTRVEAAIGHYLRWMERYPDVRSLAAAEESAVLTAWSGLGYYARARNLHRGARHVVAAHGGCVPDTEAALREVPGIGPYTAGAVASIAFGRRSAAVDGNVLRVLARWSLERAEVRSSAGFRRLSTLAASLVSPERPGDWNQALMELGATVCTPRSPRCEACPVADRCAARRAGAQTEVPVRRQRIQVAFEDVHLGLHLRAGPEGGEVLLAPGPESGLLAGLWRLPAIEAPTVGGTAAAPVEHRFTHRAWRMHVHTLGALPDDTSSCRWVPLARLAEWPLSTAMHKALAAGLAARPKTGSTPGDATGAGTTADPA